MIVRALVLALLLTSPALASWDSFQIIEWQPRNEARLDALRRIGVTATMVMEDRDGTGIPLPKQTAAPRAAGLRWYIENIATDFYSSYHRYTPDRPVNWRFVAAQERYRADPSDNAALVRDPSFLDLVWRERIRARLTETVRLEKSFHPLYYSLGDETGIADLTAYWDFDLSPLSVAGFRDWLHGQYGSLAALNEEWGTSYPYWAAIQPATTNEAMRSSGKNFAAWNDFKAWMDTSFADALRFGTDAIHRADPAALSGMEGVQTPGWGGYNYAKLANVVDVMEISFDGEELPILRSINPRLIPLITSPTASPAEAHRIWRALLRGARGVVLWDEDDGIARTDASLGPRATAYEPLFAALRGPLGRRVIAAEPVYDAVAILYSPVSFRVNWMLDHRPDGEAWMHRSSEMELQDNAWRVALRDYAAALGRMGLRPRFITERQLASGPPSAKVLILPHSIAFSPAAAASINAFAARGGQVIADTPPGTFDGHGRGLPAPSAGAEIVPPDRLAAAITIRPAYRVEAPNNDVDTYLFRSRGHLLLALQSHEARGTTEPVTILLDGAHARDIVTGRDYGRPARLAVTVDPIEPTFLEIER